MKKQGIILTILGTLLFFGLIAADIIRDYNYDKNFMSYWNLAEKASTIDQKSRYMDMFVNALEQSHCFGEYNAVVFKTPDNSFNDNLIALKSLQKRLHEIKVMDVTSFQYQTAIQQITAQEQGEAADMITVFKGVYTKTHYPFLWSWWGVFPVIICFGLIGLGVFFIIRSDD